MELEKNEFDYKIDDICVDEQSGTYSFEISVDAKEHYAGAEFGLICSQGVEINAVDSEADSMTGPKEANGLVWFGYFDGEDAFYGPMTVIVEGTYNAKMDSAVVIRDTRVYTIGEEEYATTDLESGTVINLSEGTVIENTGVPSGDNGINMIGLLAIFMVIGAIVTSVLIYKKKKGNRKDVLQETSD